MIDYRLPQYRRDVFLKFYQFHIKYKAHPGAVYYMIPYLRDHLGLNTEEVLWLCFINGVSQNIITSWLIFSEFPSPHNIDRLALSGWFRKEYDRLGWDTDRRYVKNKFEYIVDAYIEQLGGQSQADFFAPFLQGDETANFRELWNKVINDFPYFGRLATFSYLEYLRIAGLPIDCDTLFLDDISGSKSHRNGLCIVLGHDELDWRKDNPVTYSDNDIDWLGLEAKSLLQQSRELMPNNRDVSYFTLESTLCCYKSWHRPNRRYANIYNDMFYDRIRRAERLHEYKKDFSLFWKARAEYLPEALRLESNMLDCGCKPAKQNHYLETGEPPMMELDYPEMTIDPKPWLRNAVLIIGCCGVGKTWLMSQLVANNTPRVGHKLGKIYFIETDRHIITGKYDGSTFAGSDRLSMSAITDIDMVIHYANEHNKLLICEGDRFMNATFIRKAQPLIVKILGDGSSGRARRGSAQSDRQLKSITTRVSKIVEDCAFSTSTEALNFVGGL